jgi:uncharacterized protein (DUF2164 family)
MNATDRIPQFFYLTDEHVRTAPMVEVRHLTEQYIGKTIAFNLGGFYYNQNIRSNRENNEYEGVLEGIKRNGSLGTSLVVNGREFMIAPSHEWETILIISNL